MKMPAPVLRQTGTLASRPVGKSVGLNQTARYGPPHVSPGQSNRERSEHCAAPGYQSTNIAALKGAEHSEHNQRRAAEGSRPSDFLEILQQILVGSRVKRELI